MANPRQPSSSREIRARARELRRAMTPSERKLWVHLRDRGLAGLKFRRQQPIGRFIVDFYCAEHRLVIELDGPIHSRQSARDRARTAWLESQGYHEVRFKNEQVNEQPQLVLNEIEGTYTNVVDQERIEYEMADGRSVAMWRILF